MYGVVRMVWYVVVRDAIVWCGVRAVVWYV